MGVEVHILNLQRPLNTDRSCAGCAFVGLNGRGYRFLQMAVIFSPLVSSLLLLVVVCLFVCFLFMDEFVFRALESFCVYSDFLQVFCS